LALTSERKVELIAIVLILVGLFTAVSMLSPNQGLVSSAWVLLLTRGFGWGSYAIPVFLLVVGTWMILERWSKNVPGMESERIFGVVLLYIGVLVGLQGIFGSVDFPSGEVHAHWYGAGGALGSVLLALFYSTLGVGGTIVALIAWLLVSITLTAGLTLPETLAIIWNGMRTFAAAVARLWRALFKPRRPARRSVRSAPRHSSVGVAQEPAAVVAEPPPVDLPKDAPPLPDDQLEQAAKVAEAADWQLPDIEVVLESGLPDKIDEDFDVQRARLIEETLMSFGAPARIVEINRGPAVTQFGVEPGFIETRGGRRTKVKVSKIASLADDLALALAAQSIRVEAPVPNKGYVGVEVPNAEVSLVALRDIMLSDSFQRIPSKLRLALGRGVAGFPIAADLTAMPHLLIAGTTGSGKSVCINAVVACLLLQCKPDELKFVMVDPKRVELTFYNGIPHLLAPVVVELDRIVPALQWVSREMDDRYRRFAHEGVRNIAEYNQRISLTGAERMPFLVVVIDELADLMMMAPDETERVITRLAQLARATGIHLVIATQRPSVDVVTGLIKANFPARIAFAVASSIDSRVILDQPGAERLLGRGDMLFQAPDAPAPTRMQGAYVSEPEMSRLLRYWKNAALGGETTQPVSVEPAETIPAGSPLTQAPLWQELEKGNEDLDELFDKGVGIVREMRRASISLLQRRLRIGYTRAARMIDQMEAKGIIGPAQRGSQPREVLDYGEADLPIEE
jgi:S-DNA-T family DNA segregation ATPase FtsK/SpoIIIE